MAGDISIKHGTATSLTITLNSLGSNSTVLSNEINVETNDPLDVLVELLLDPGTTSGNQQVVVYAVSCLDGTNFSDSAAASFSRNAALVGIVYVPDTNVVRSKAMSVAAAFGGTLPNRFKILAHNDSGVALAASGNSAQYVEVEAQYT